MRKKTEAAPKKWAGIIYVLTNLLNSRQYVGYDTSCDPENHRWKGHIKDALDRNSQYPIHRAIRKAHERDKCLKNFSAEVIQHCHTLVMLKKAEIRWIKQLNTMTPHGYNQTRGGDGVMAGLKHKKETREKMSATHLARFENPAEHEKRSAMLRQRYENLAEREKTGAASRIAMLRKYKDPAEREKASLAALQRWSDIAEHEKASVIQLRSYAENPRRREKLSASQVRSYKEHPERLQRASAAQQLRYEDPAERKKTSVALLHAYENPAARKRQSESRTTEERSATAKLAWKKYKATKV